VALWLDGCLACSERPRSAWRFGTTDETGHRAWSRSLRDHLAKRRVCGGGQEWTGLDLVYARQYPEAKTHLSRLGDQAAAGEEIITARPASLWPYVAYSGV